MSESDLTWQPYLQSWIQSKSDKEVQALLTKLADKLLQRALDARRKCVEPVSVSDFHAVMSLCRLFDSLAKPEMGLDPADETNYIRLVEVREREREAINNWVCYMVYYGMVV